MASFPSIPGQGGDGGAAAAFHGALITNTAVNLSTTFGAKSFVTEEYDTDAIADIGTNDERLTVPAGMTKAKVSGHVDVGNMANANHVQGVIRHYNSSDTLLAEYGNETRTGFALRGYICVDTPTIVVATGDYFQLWTDCQDSSTSANISLGLEYKDGTL